MKVFRITEPLVLACVLVGVSVAQRSPRQSHEQTSFSAEDEGVKKPVPVPEEVLALLAADELVRNTMENDDSPLKAPPPDWFSASVIHLGPQEEKDLIVQATGPLRGANVDTFWVFRRTPNRPALVLTAPVHDLEVMKARWNGYRNIELFSATAVNCSTVRLRFSGVRYVVYRSRSGPIPHC